MGNRVRRDMLSDLPLGIIHYILGRLPIREAIRTSVLSRQWRYTWTTLPRLLFYVHVLDGLLLEDFEEATNNFITNVLLHHRGPIHRFEIFYWCHFRIELFEKWLLFLATNDIRQLIMKTVEQDCKCLLGSSIYSCTKLTELELWSFTLKPPPSTFKGFLFLTSLILENMCSKGVEILLANSPLLERLTIMDYQISTRITVNAPNLKYFNLFGDYTELCLYAPLLAQMYMRLLTDNFTRERQSSDCNYSNFFGCFTDLVELTGHYYFTRYLSIGIESCHGSLVLHHLKVIKLATVNFGDTKEMSVVARLIIAAPNLHRLEISAMEKRDELGGPNVSFKDFGCAPNFTLSQLRVVSMSNVCGYLFGRQIIKFLLECSPFLDTLKLGSINKEASAELLGFRRASPNARILVNVV